MSHYLNKLNITTINLILLLQLEFFSKFEYLIYRGKYAAIPSPTIYINGINNLPIASFSLGSIGSFHVKWCIFKNLLHFNFLDFSIRVHPCTKWTSAKYYFNTCYSSMLQALYFYSRFIEKTLKI